MDFLLESSFVFDINGYAFFILLMLYIILQRDREDYEEAGRLFGWILLLTMGMLFAEYVAVHGTRTLGSWIIRTAMFLTFALGTILVWPIFRWFSLQLDLAENSLRPWQWAVGAICALDVLLLVASLHTGWYFSFDGRGLYHRGNMFELHMVLSLLGVFLIMSLILVYQRALRSDSLYSLLFFPIPILAVGIGSLFFFKAFFLPASLAFSLIYIFLNVQVYAVEQDHLTKTYNRRRLELYLRRLMQDCLPGMMFAVLLIDLENLRQINLAFGRKSGDEALQTVARIIKQCAHGEGLVARSDTHRFCIVLHDIMSSEDIMHMLKAVQAEAVKVNAQQEVQLNLRNSSCIYSTNMMLSPEEFLRRLDAEY